MTMTMPIPTIGLNGWTRTWRYPLAIAIVLILGWIRVLLDPYVIGEPFVLFLPGVLLAAVILSRGSALVVTGGACLFALWLMEPKFSLASPTAPQMLSLLVFGGVCVTVGLVASQLRAARLRVEGLWREKELLLREFNHRVRNDLGSLLALIRLERGRVGEAARQRLDGLEQRVSVLARVYEKLWTSEGSGMIQARPFLEELILNLRLAHVGERPIGLVARIDNVAIPVECATPLGLIVNELVTNSLKYAFPDLRTGRIGVTLTRDGEDLVAEVEDNGVGLAQGGQQEPNRGFGRVLVEQLAQQLAGSAVTTGNGGGGVRTVVRFPARRLG